MHVFVFSSLLSIINWVHRLSQISWIRVPLSWLLCSCDMPLHFGGISLLPGITSCFWLLYISPRSSHFSKNKGPFQWKLVLGTRCIPCSGVSLDPWYTFLCIYTYMRVFYKSEAHSSPSPQVSFLTFTLSVFVSFPLM